uniref:Uncharacterized protein n=1 Tax=Amphimedon queenslandica TaxID=400682 RepID=A0A1X7V5T1_AMPQE
MEELAKGIAAMADAMELQMDRQDKREKTMEKQWEIQEKNMMDQLERWEQNMQERDEKRPTIKPLVLILSSLKERDNKDFLTAFEMSIRLQDIEEDWPQYLVPLLGLYLVARFEQPTAVLMQTPNMKKSSRLY